MRKFRKLVLVYQWWYCEFMSRYHLRKTNKFWYEGDDIKSKHHERIWCAYDDVQSEILNRIKKL